VELREQPELGARIRELRETAGVEQSTLADAAGLRQPDISKIERGERSVSAVELFRIADCLDVRADDILVPVVELELQVAFRAGDTSDAGAREAVELVEQLARELDHLRALAP
jgi:transcriptional regulator with XRE-family HTH domain